MPERKLKNFCARLDFCVPTMIGLDTGNIFSGRSHDAMNFDTIYEKCSFQKESVVCE